MLNSQKETKEAPGAEFKIKRYKLLRVHPTSQVNAEMVKKIDDVLYFCPPKYLKAAFMRLFWDFYIRGNDLEVSGQQKADMRFLYELLEGIHQNIEK